MREDEELAFDYAKIVAVIAQADVEDGALPGNDSALLGSPIQRRRPSVQRTSLASGLPTSRKRLSLQHTGLASRLPTLRRIPSLLHTSFVRIKHQELVVGARQNFAQLSLDAARFPRLRVCRRQ